MKKFMILLLVCIVCGIVIYSTLPTCIKFILERSSTDNTFDSASFFEIEDLKKAYNITYNLDEGTANNPTTYTLFTKTFTLTNPVKENYEFIGWTGSNGTEPQTTVTINFGSSGDLEFTANYAFNIGVPEVTREEYILSWNAIEKAEGYEVSLNGTAIFLTNDTTFDISEHLEELQEGSNIFNVRAKTSVKNGLNATKFEFGKYSADLEFVYYNTSNFEDLTLNVEFSSDAGKYRLTATGGTYVEYSDAGEFLTGVYSAEGVDFLYEISPKTAVSTLTFNNYSMFELMLLCKNAYTKDIDNITIAIQDYFKFILKDSIGTAYIPNKLTLNVTYGYVYEEVGFKDGDTIYINDLSTKNSLSYTEGEGSVTSLYYYRTELTLTDIYGTTYQFHYIETLTNNPEPRLITYKVVHFGNLEEVDFEDIKIYLNEDYYLKMNRLMNPSAYMAYMAQLNSIVDNLHSERETNGTAETIKNTLDVTSMFDVYSISGDKVEFDYTLLFNYTSTED